MTQDHDYLPPARTPWNEGKTLAAWLTIWLIVLGGALASVGFLVPGNELIIAGGIVIVLALVAGKVLAILGYGKGGAATVQRDRKALSRGRSH